MGIFSSLRSGVSGLAAQSQSMSMIADNIANVQTVAYKINQPRFSTLVTGQTSDRLYTSGGVQSSVGREIDRQGLPQTGSSPTDLAVSGTGFFAVTNKLTLNQTTGIWEPTGEIFYTRAGDFRADTDGNLKNSSNFFLLGFPRNSDDTGYDETNVLTALQGVNVAGRSVPPVPTSGMSLRANLQASAKTGDTFQTTVQIFDRQGTKHSLTLTFTKVASKDIWNVSGTLDNGAFIDPDANNDGSAADLDDGGATGSDTAADDILGSEEVRDFAGGGDYSGLGDTAIGTSTASFGSVKFNADGTLSVISNTPDGAANNTGIALTGGNTMQVLVDYDSDDTTSGDVVAIDINLGTIGGSDGLTQFAGSSTLNGHTQNGKQSGSLSSVGVNRDGEVTATFSNQEQRQLFQVPLVTFNNPNGLDPRTGSVYAETETSGQAVVKVPNAGGAGRILSTALESSTVDLADEFSKMIVTQRAFAANTRTITTADEMLDELIRTKR